MMDLHCGGFLGAFAVPSLWRMGRNLLAHHGTAVLDVGVGQRFVLGISVFLRIELRLFKVGECFSGLQQSTAVSTRLARKRMWLPWQ